MIEITSQIWLKEDELTYSFIRSPGPGGQNVNKVATAVLLRFNVQQSSSLSETMRQRLLMKLENKLTLQGDILIKATQYRTQDRNKRDALERLCTMIKTAATPAKLRRKTKPTYASKQRRITEKKMNAKTKALRHRSPNFE